MYPRTAAASPVKLDVKLVEADLVTDPRPQASGFTHGNLRTGDWRLGTSADGIALDAFGNPVAYFVLRGHPAGICGKEMVDPRVMATWSRLAGATASGPGRR